MPFSILAAESAHTVATSPLTAAIVLPFVGALVVALVPRGRVELPAWWPSCSPPRTGAITLWVLAAFEPSDAGFQFEVKRTGSPTSGSRGTSGIDGISLFLVVLTGLLFPLAIVAVAPHHDPKPYYAWLLVLQAGASACSARSTCSCSS